MILQRVKRIAVASCAMLLLVFLSTPVLAAESAADSDISPVSVIEIEREAMDLTGFHFPFGSTVHWGGECDDDDGEDDGEDDDDDDEDHDDDDDDDEDIAVPTRKLSWAGLKSAY